VAWNLTSGAARVASATRMRRRWSPPATPMGPGDVFDRAAARAAASLSAADRKALDAAFAEIGADAPVLRRALATGAHVRAVASLAAAWATFDDRERAFVRDPLGRRTPGPVRILDVPAVQVDQTTCGAASLGMMLMMGDPFVAAWVATGRHIGDYVPLEPYMAEALSREVRTVEERWRSLQHELHREVRRWALAVAPWPRRFGTPPWRLDDAVRFAGVRFRTRLIDDRSRDDLAAFFAHASVALVDGIPVLLYVGGDIRGGLAAAIPRHVVLVVERLPGGVLVYEPGAGALFEVADEQMRAGGPDPVPGLGWWSRLTCVVLPAARRGVSLTA